MSVNQVFDLCVLSDAARNYHREPAVVASIQEHVSDIEYHLNAPELTEPDCQYIGELYHGSVIRFAHTRSHITHETMPIAYAGFTSVKWLDDRNVPPGRPLASLEGSGLTTPCDLTTDELLGERPPGVLTRGGLLAIYQDIAGRRCLVCRTDTGLAGRHIFASLFEQPIELDAFGEKWAQRLLTTSRLNHCILVWKACKHLGMFHNNPVFRGCMRSEPTVHVEPDCIAPYNVLTGMSMHHGVYQTASISGGVPFFTSDSEALLIEQGLISKPAMPVSYGLQGNALTAPQRVILGRELVSDAIGILPLRKWMPSSSSF